MSVAPVRKPRRLSVQTWGMAVGLVSGVAAIAFATLLPEAEPM